MSMRGVESALENIVTSVFSRSRSTIRPVELGRRLLREIDDHRTVDVKGRRVVPNDFVFHLSQRDYAGFSSFEDELKHELCEAASSYALDEGYHLVGPVKVELIVDDALKPGRFGIASQVVKQAAPSQAAPSQAAPSQAAPAQPAPTQAPPAEPAASLAPPIAALDDAAIWASASPAPQTIPPPPPFVLPPSGPEVVPPLPPIVPLEPVSVYDAEADITADPRPTASPRATVVITASGERIAIGQRPASIGRLPECDITVADVNVSRRHAEIRPGSEFTLVDLGSTNGTKVNGSRIDGSHVLRNGDVITVGGSQIRFEAS